MTTKKGNLFLFFLFLNIHISIAQVTIGIDEKPVDGAILQLKDGTDNNNVLENASKGLSLPRVQLLNTTLNSDYPNLSKTIKGASGDWSAEEHIGLVVYNMTNELCKPPQGLYVWDGTEWVLLDAPRKEEDVRTIIDDGSQITITYKDETTSYYYHKFGSAGTWMTQNLATRYLPNGALITQQPTASNETPYCFIPGSKSSITREEGLLYNWVAAMNMQVCVTVNQAQGTGENEVEQLNGGPIKGICPKGWHMPSDRELNQLEKEIANNLSKYSTLADAPNQWDTNWETYPTSLWRGHSHGKAMRRTASPANGASKSPDQGGFDMPFVGYANGSVDRYGVQSYLWSSSADINGLTWRRSFTAGYPNQVLRSSSSRQNLFSIRCKKD